MISLIIPTLNEEKFLPKLLDSLVCQTQHDFEVIVVDGSSKDKTVDVANSFASKLPKFQVIMSKKASLPLQRNLGARHAEGEWIMFLDADDVLLPYALNRCIQFIRTHNEAKLFTSWFTSDSGESGDATLILISNLFVEASKIVKRQIAPGPFIVIQRDVFERMGGFDEHRDYGEDQEFSMRLYEHGIPLSMLRETLYIYSLRRFRRLGTLKMVQTYAKNSLIALLTKRAPSREHGYIMGGQLYQDLRKKQSRGFNGNYSKLRSILKEMFGM